MKRITTLAFAVLAGLMAFALPAFAQDAPYTDVGGAGGSAGGAAIGNVPDPAAAGGAAQLAQTGFDLTIALVLALGLLALGALAVAAARRRSTA